MKILVVDDEEANLVVLQSVLQRDGFTQLLALQDPREVLGCFESFEPDLLILDYRMPHLDGLAVIEALRPVLSEDSYFPILMLTADDNADVRRKALAGGARDFLTKPLSAVEVRLRVRNLLEARRFHLQLLDQNRFLEERVRERTAQLEHAQIEMLVRLSQAAEYRDEGAGERVWRVSRLAAMLAKRLGAGSERVDLILRASRLHDVGMIAIPDGIWLKRGELSAAEAEIVELHTVRGAQLLSGGQSELIRLAEAIALTHHEHWDGSGYPNGLKGDAIPLEGRILAVADAYTAVTDEAHSGGTRGVREAVDGIVAKAGTEFDPQVTEALRALFQRGELDPEA
ncbi:MAG: HD domain-containing phosphohydrolase [Trueperaceae bacterium]